MEHSVTPKAGKHRHPFPIAAERPLGRIVLPTRARSSSLLAGAQPLLLPAAGTGILWLTSVAEVAPLQVLLSFLLLCLPCWSYLHWKRQARFQLPFFAIISLMYWVYYAVPLFWGDHFAPAAGKRGYVLPEATITGALFLALLSVAALGCGMRNPLVRPALRTVVDVPDDPRRWLYLRGILVLTSLFALASGAVYAFGEAGRQLVLTLQRTVPTVAFLILFRAQVAGRSAPGDRLFIALLLAFRLMVGTATGWLGNVALIALGCLMVFLSERKKPPTWLMLAGLVCMLFLQPGKSDFRDRYWYGGETGGGTTERLSFWLDRSLTHWKEALEGTGNVTALGLTQETVMRASLLTQTANVLELTPAQVPYQQGATYATLGTNWIPRFLWPEKPSANEANRFYQVAYGLTRADDLEHVAIGVGVPTEAYINFGWWGVLGVMYLIGCLFGFVETMFLTRDAGLLFSAAGVMLMLQFVCLESQLAVYLGNTVQQLLIVLLILLPIIAPRRREETGGGAHR